MSCRVASLEFFDTLSGLIGDVTAEDLRKVWEHSPLAFMSEILSLKSLQEDDDGTSWRPRVSLVSPLVDVYRTSKRWKL